MNNAAHSSYDRNAEVERAEELVAANLAKFETAMDQLELKMNESRAQIQRSVSIAKKPFLRAKDIGAKAWQLSRTTSQHARANPKPYLAAAAVVAVAGITLFFFRRGGRA